MNFFPAERVGLFIDGPNLHATSKALDLDIDFERLLGIFRGKAQLVRATYYAVELEGESCGRLHSLLDWLGCNGFKTVISRHRDSIRGAERMAIALSVDGMLLAPALDHVVIVSGNACFRPLVEALQQAGKRVSVLSTRATRPPMIADELRRRADHFIDLADLRDQIQR